jgi:hypothetical protein
VSSLPASRIHASVSSLPASPKSRVVRRASRIVVCRPASSGCKPHCCIHHLAASRIVQQGRVKLQFTRNGPRSGPSAITATQRAPIKSTRRRRCPHEDFHKTPVGNTLHSLPDELVKQKPVVSDGGLLRCLERCSHSPRMPTTGACKIPCHVRNSFC